jgi:tetratricopeptide (TPR) repeat protein
MASQGRLGLEHLALLAVEAEPEDPMNLPPGTVVASRFIIEQLAGRGGMGSVFQAQDMLSSGRTVALKLLHATGNPQALKRFTREAELLAELRHPGIVTYVAHGVADGHQPFLAMEWLEGESLAQRLGRQPLDVAQTLMLLRRITEALGTVHRRGIVHRDIKPSNLFLRSGRVEDVILLDFGLARHIVPSQILTGYAALLGTPGYMAPEQAANEVDLTPGADIFALGCVLYECLTGQPPFTAPTLPAVLAKILFVEPPPLSRRRQELSASWQRLMDSMLAKNPKQRLHDAASLQAALSVLDAGSPGGLPPPRMELASTAGLAGGAQQLVSVLLATPLVRAAEASTMTFSEEPPQGRQLLDSLRVELGDLGARVSLLADGSLLAMFLPERGVATDQASLAARSALLLKERWPEARVVLTTGRGLLSEGALVGEAMDRAGALQRSPGDSSASPAAHPMLDELTAGLLGPGFLLSRAQEGTFLLQGEHWSADETRPLLGKPTPCVGRERELAMLELAFAGCTEESSARALLVTGPAGIGKSRLRHEFLRRLERRGQPLLVLLGRGDPARVKAADSLLAQALRRLCSIQEGEQLAVRREKLARRLSQHLSPAQVPTTLEFLTELCGLSSPTDDSPRLRAARKDPTLMSAQVAWAWLTFLRAEFEHGPVLLVLEDLHWGDSLTVRLVDEALLELSECPLLVLALARPEVKTAFPSLWSRCLSELSLGKLSEKAGTRLVHEVLGANLPPSLTQRIIRQAGGNALFLEELIRAVKEGRGESPPETVVAMLQARLLQLEPEAKQALLAASFFGRAFWPGGVRMLLGEGNSAKELEHRLRQLVELEMIEPQPDSRFPGEAEFRFRHALLWDAAQELVPASHKPTFHQLAGQWLEQVGEPDLLVLAEHFQLGQEPERASHLYTRAVEKHFGMEELPQVLRWLEVAMISSTTSERSARLRVLRSCATLFSGDFERAFEIGQEVLPELKAGSSSWCLQLTFLLTCSLLSNNHATVVENGRRLLAAEPAADAVDSYVDAIWYLASLSACRGARQETMALLARAKEVSATQVESQALIRGMLAWIEGFSTYALEARPWRAWELAAHASRAFDETGLEYKQMSARTLEGLTLEALGDRAGAVEKLREGQELVRPLKRLTEIQLTDTHLALVLSGSTEEAHREEARTLALKWAESPGMHTGMAYIALAQVAADPREAEALARTACEASIILFQQLRARACLSRILLTQGQAAEARQLAMLGVQELEKTGSQIIGSGAVYLALAEACYAQGDIEAGDAALRQAVQCLEARASDIPNRVARERFLRQVPENARTLELAHQRAFSTSGMSSPHS